MNQDNICRFADIQILRYELPYWDTLTLNQKQLIKHLSDATLWGRDITFDQFGKYNLQIRSLMETIHEHDPQDADVLEYLQRIWFSSGIYHHYSCSKFLPKFSREHLIDLLRTIPAESLPLRDGQSMDDMLAELMPVIFDPEVLPTRVNQKQGDDLIITSANNFYDGVSQSEAEAFYADRRAKAVAEGATKDELPSFGLNSRLVKDADGTISEEAYSVNGRYGYLISRIVECLEQALPFAESDDQREAIRLLIDYYRTGDLRTFDDYSIKWVSLTQPRVDFINGFIEVYADAIGLKGSWEGIVHYKDLEATKRTQTLSSNAQWFEDHSPVDPRFRKAQVKGVTANVVCAAMLGGDEYPSTAIGINLPNADWIRAKHGSKSITISNITKAYDRAAQGNGFREEYIPDVEVREIIKRYGYITDDLHTDLHECLGHGSGQLLPGVSPDATKSYASTIEEARADLFGLYYMADPYLVELGLLPDTEAYKAQYYSYLLNGLLTQCVRIPLGEDIQEAHMRNRALIANWVYEHCDDCMQLYKTDGKTYLRIHDYTPLRALFGRLLAEVQRIKSEGDHEAARQLVETYAVKLNPDLHREIFERYQTLNIAPYKGFLNPVFSEIKDPDGNVIDVTYDLTESYNDQMMRYSREYSF